MKRILKLMLLFSISLGYAQIENRVSTIDFVQILDQNKEEVLFYYENNWKVLRDMALEKNYIHSYQLLETPLSENEPFQVILITTYTNKEQHDLAENRFDELIAQRGPVRLMNHKKPGEFRKILFNKLATHLH